MGLFSDTNYIIALFYKNWIFSWDMGSINLLNLLPVPHCTPASLISLGYFLFLQFENY